MELTLFESFDDFFVSRTGATTQEVARAKKYISRHVEELGNALTRKRDPYAWKIPYVIATCKKKLN